MINAKSDTERGLSEEEQVLIAALPMIGVPWRKTNLCYWERSRIVVIAWVYIQVS